MNLFGSQLDASFKLASSYLTYKSLKINQILRGYKKMKNKSSQLQSLFWRTVRCQNLLFFLRSLYEYASFTMSFQ